MVDVKFIRNNLDFVRRKLEERGTTVALERFVYLEERRRRLLGEVEGLRSERNLRSRLIGEKKKKNEEVTSLLEEMATLSARIKELETSLEEIEREFKEVLLTFPNIPHDSVPVGKSAEENAIIRVWGEKREFSFPPKPHWEIGEMLGILDFGRAAKISGTRFALLRGLGALLERALINFMLAIHVEEHHYEEIWPPFLVNRASMTATGQLPKFATELFKVEGDEYFLIPTAEVPVTNIHREEILRERDLPLRYVAYSACFRAEAGSYGKDTRGLIRQHQFNKVELVKFTTPETSYEELEKLTADAEEVLKRLCLPYRTVCLCTGDLGFAAAKTYDLEVWLPGQGVYREISSCSNFEDFQARRGQIRFRREDSGKIEFVHTLNGSGLAVGRTMVAILENYQQEDGSVVIPEVLRPFMKGVDRISPPR